MDPGTGQRLQAERQAQVSKMLYTRRSQIDPQAHDFERPVGRGRRSEGLSQYQMDTLLQRGMGTYGRFERCDPAFNPTPDFLHDVAHFLQLNEREWGVLWLFWYGQQPPHPLSSTIGLTVPQLYTDLLPRMGEVAAYVSNRRWKVLISNKNAAALFPGGIMPDNTMRWMMSEEARTHYLPNWHHLWAPRALGQLRAAVDDYPEDEELAELEAEIINDPHSGPIYKGYIDPYIHPDGDVRPWVHGTLDTYGVLAIGTTEPRSARGARLMFMDWSPAAPVVVHEPSSGGRRVEVYMGTIGRARSTDDLVAMLRNAGVGSDLDNPDHVEWRGCGIDVW